MADSLPLQIVVADDVCRFALYVWRYLSRSIGFGTSDVPNDPGDDSAFQNGRTLISLPTAARDADVWWINIKNETWGEDLDVLLDKIGKEMPRLFLVDVRGPYGSGDAGKLVNRLVRKNIKVSDNDKDSEVLFVSSYSVAPIPVWLEDGGEPLHIGVHSKSPETLEWIFRRTHSVADPRKASFLQVLVTGAGFEIHDQSMVCRRLGMRSTADVLEKTLNATFDAKAGGGSGFSLPQIHSKKRSLQTAARTKDLDRYWNELLLLELSRIAKEERGNRREEKPTVGQVKLHASRHEYRLREDFRQQFLADDWGFLGQALNVLKMKEDQGLVAWLTTNYTRFADRAIELWTLHNKRKGGMRGPAWRIISTGSEAERLLREFLHNTQRTEGHSERDGVECMLFKLHGDLAHLLTMAIAGHDKNISSPLSLPISGLHSVYVAADLHLKRCLARKEQVLWHIVGHGLKDNLLVEVLVDVCRDNPEQHCFVVVDPISPKGKEILSKRLRGATVLGSNLGADEYMAQIVRNPPLALDQLQNWVKQHGWIGKHGRSAS